MLHYNGSSWSPVQTGYPAYFRGVWGSSADNVFAVGYTFTENVILRFDGNSWATMTITPPSDCGLCAVWGSSATDVFAAGFCGIIYHYNGSTWSPMNSRAGNELRSVWGSSGSDVFAVGVSGTILRYAETPTLIELSSFTASPSSRTVHITWSTASEIDNAGFNIYRAEAEDGEYIKINLSLIPAKGSSIQGAAYEFTDADVNNLKTYWYKLEDIDLNGISTLHGPVSATPRLIYGQRR
jgi:hypothetical protein